MAKASKGSIGSKIDNLLQSSRETTESPAACTAVHLQDSQELLPQVQDDGELQDPLVLGYSGDTSPILESRVVWLWRTDCFLIILLHVGCLVIPTWRLNVRLPDMGPPCTPRQAIYLLKERGLSATIGSEANLENNQA